MVKLNGERLRKWRERRAIKREEKELRRVLREPGERQEREARLERELRDVTREAKYLKEMAELQKTKAELTEARRTLAPQRYGGVRKILGQLGEVGARQTATFRGEQPQQRRVALDFFGSSTPSQKPLRFGEIPRVRLPGAQPGPLISPFYPQRKKKGR